MPYFQSLAVPPVPVVQPVPPPPGPGKRHVPPLPRPSDLDPGTAHDFSQYPVGGVWTGDPEAVHRLNTRGATATLLVLNVGDRAIQVGSHIHLADVNDDLLFFTDEDAAGRAEEVLSDEEVPLPRRIAAARALAHDRSKTPGRAPWGFRLDIPPGHSRRFEPETAPSATVEVVEIGGNRRVPGLRRGKRAVDVALD